MRPLRATANGLLILALAGCARPALSTSPSGAERTSQSPSQPAAAHAGGDDDGSRGLAFERSPGGTSEVAPELVASWLGGHKPPSLRLIDVREKAELSDELGQIPGAQSIPLGELAAASEGWDPAAPIVLVCRSGRRSARGAELLESLGFRNVASMTGGMLRWHDLGLPTRVAGPTPPADAPQQPALAAAAGERALVQVDPGSVRWIRTATLLTTGSESCVDGRDPHAVVGTPGGDTGELVLALAAAEQASGRALSEQEIRVLFDAWIATFGRLYMHTDEHALEALGRALARDPRFAALSPTPDVNALEKLVRRPPRPLEAVLLEHLLEPSSVGCGHLHAMLVAPGDYRVRRELVSMVLRHVFEHLWRDPETIDWVVLSGEHRERAVVVVQLEGEVRPYTKIPAIAPASGLGQTFVIHPQVTAFLREQNVHFLLDHVPELRRHVSHDHLLATLRSVAQSQLDATLSRLARGLPRYELRFAADAAAAPRLVSVSTPEGAPLAP